MFRGHGLHRHPEHETHRACFFFSGVRHSRLFGSAKCGARRPQRFGRLAPAMLRACAFDIPQKKTHVDRMGWGMIMGHGWAGRGKNCSNRSQTRGACSPPGCRPRRVDRCHTGTSVGQNQIGECTRPHDRKGDLWAALSVEVAWFRLQPDTGDDEVCEGTCVCLPPCVCVCGCV